MNLGMQQENAATVTMTTTIAPTHYGNRDQMQAETTQTNEITSPEKPYCLYVTLLSMVSTR